MRRVRATLLLVLFSLSLIGPVVFAGASEDIPACCRRGGRHHCMMADGSADAGSPSGKTLLRAREKCPFYVIGHALPAPGKFAPGTGLTTAPGLIVHQPLPSGEVHAGYRIFRSRSCLKRGPPSFVS